MTSGTRSDAAPGRHGRGRGAPGGRTRRDLILAVALAAVAGGARGQSQAGSPAFDLEALMALLAKRKSGEARFTEERTVAGFDGPLRASGTLTFTAPDRFARVTLEPQRERMEVAGNQIRLERGGRVRQLTLDAVPELAALVEGLRGTLTGNAELLRRHFEVGVGGHAGLWTLKLTPRDSAIATQVRLLQLAGSGGDLRSVELAMGNGDRSLMQIEPVVAAAATSAAATAPTSATSKAPSSATTMPNAANAASAATGAAAARPAAPASR